MATILVIDDAFHEVRESLDSVLREHDVVGATDGRAALTALQDGAAVDVILLDVRMPPQFGVRREEEGLAVSHEIQRLFPEIPIIFLSTYDDLHTINQALTEGGFWYLKKPPDYDETRFVIERALLERQRRRQAADLNRASHARVRAANREVVPRGDSKLIGDSVVMRRLGVELATFAATDLPVLLLGESGTGKELCARELHSGSARRKGPFVAVNCYELNNLEAAQARICGHSKGAFTGADVERPGLFELAEGGTLFFDEVGDLHPTIQGQLLRALQEREFVRMGAGEMPRPFDVRLVFATDKDVDRLLDEGRLSEPFYYRINVGALRIPPLRERLEDLELLVPALLERARTEDGIPICRVTDETYDVLRGIEWRGNVRELQNVLRRAAVRAGETGVIEPERLDVVGRPTRATSGAGATTADGEALVEELISNGGFEGGLKRFRNVHGENMLREVLLRAGRRTGSWRRAGELLGFIRGETSDKDYEALRWWLKQLGLRKEHLRIEA